MMEQMTGGIMWGIGLIGLLILTLQVPLPQRQTTERSN